MRIYLDDKKTALLSLSTVKVLHGENWMFSIHHHN